MPICTLFGGANGSGKSSIVAALSPPGEFVNADIVARQIDPAHPESVSLTAGREVLRRLEDLIQARSDFTYETTLSGRQPLDLMRRVGLLGYRVHLVFVVLADVDLNVKRVAQRVARGGHNIPEPMIRRRHLSALSRLGAALSFADETVIVDNTTQQPLVLVRIDSGRVIENKLDAKHDVHARIAKALAELP